MSPCLYSSKAVALYNWLWYLVFSALVSVFALWKSLQQSQTRAGSREILIHFGTKGEHRRIHAHTHTNISSLQAFVLWHSMKVTLKGDAIFLPNCIQERLKEPIWPLIFWEEVHIVPNLFHQLSLPHYLPRPPRSPVRIWQNNLCFCFGRK